MELWFSVDIFEKVWNTMVLYNTFANKKYGIERNGAIPKTMKVYQKLRNFDLLWKKLWYYAKNYETIVI